MEKADSSLSLHAQAQQVQARGRGDDTVLIHMTPHEVSGLQELAKAHGGSLTINPDTGLPEAGFLSSILPMVLGGLLTMIPGVGPLAAAGMVAAGGTAVTGDLKQGLLAGLGAFGGASLAGAAGLAGGASGLFGGGAAGAGSAAGAGLGAAAGSAGASGATGAGAGLLAGGNAAAATAGQNAALIAGQQAIAAPTLLGSTGALSSGIGSAGLGGIGAGNAAAGLTAAAGASGAGAAGMNLAGAVPGLTSIAAPAATAAPGFLSKFATISGDAAKSLGLPKMAGTGLAATGVLQPFMQQYNQLPVEEDKNNWNYEGPYTAQDRVATFRGPQFQGAPSDSAEYSYFNNANPYPGFVTPGALMPGLGRGIGYAKGGNVALDDGAFVVDARTVSELGNGSSGAGQELLARYGGEPIQGPGDGVSDSIRANIGGTQEARVARDEVKFDPRAVARIGGGSQKKGAEKLYAMMARAHADRKKATRGSDTGASGLEAIK